MIVETCDCINGGRCMNGPNGLTFCECPFGFSGPKCESSAQCSFNNCNNRGNCSLVNQKMECLCQGKFQINLFHFRFDFEYIIYGLYKSTFLYQMGSLVPTVKTKELAWQIHARMVDPVYQLLTTSTLHVPVLVDSPEHSATVQSYRTNVPVHHAWMEPRA